MQWFLTYAGSGIEVTRSKPGESLAKTIEESNAGDYDLHIWLGSLDAPSYATGAPQGPIVLYNGNNSKSKEAASIIADNFKAIYPRPALVKTFPNQTLSELKDTKAYAHFS